MFRKYKALEEKITHLSAEIESCNRRIEVLMTELGKTNLKLAEEINKLTLWAEKVEKEINEALHDQDSRIRKIDDRNAAHTGVIEGYLKEFNRLVTELISKREAT